MVHPKPACTMAAATLGILPEAGRRTKGLDSSFRKTSLSAVSPLSEVDLLVSGCSASCRCMMHGDKV